MKLIKTIGLLVVAALAAMAFVGVSSASATTTTLCGTDSGTTCPSPLSHIHDVDPAMLLLNDFTGYVECIGLALSSSILTKVLGLPIHIIFSLSFSSCEDEAGRSCTATELNGPSLKKKLKTGTELASIVGEGEVLVRCGFFIHCVYNGENLEGTAEGALHAGGTGLYNFHNAVVNHVSGFCPETAELDALYAPLSATYIRE